MSDLIVQLNNGANWIPFYSRTFTAQPIGTTRFKPIGSTLLPVQSEERILAVRGISPEAKQNWRTAGWLVPILDLNATDFGEARLRQQAVPLLRTGLISLPDFRVPYSLQFDAAWWLQEIRLNIWQYVGPVDDSTEALIKQLGAGLNINL